MPKPSPTDAIVIGAGPVGLWTVFELGLLGISCSVIDTLSGPGGQCAALYADKPIYDIPGLPVVTGDGLTQALMKQVQPFHPEFHWRSQVSELSQADGLWQIVTQGLDHKATKHFASRCVFIAAGVGAFMPKAPSLDGMARLVGTDIFYESPPIDRFREGQRVCVLGGEQEAVDCALSLLDAPRKVDVTLLHRRDVYRADPETLARLAQFKSEGRIRTLVGQPARLVLSGSEKPGLKGLEVDTPEDGVMALDFDLLIVAQGISPKLGPLPAWGLQMSRKQLVVDAATCSTSAQGIFAVGDIVDYPGKKKLIVSGFHEATQAAFAAARTLRPQEAGPLQYTTSSTLLQQRLGIA